MLIVKKKFHVFCIPEAIKHKPKSRKFDRFNYVNVCKVSLILSPNGCPMSLKCSSKVIYSSLILLCPFEFRALINVLLKYYLVNFHVFCIPEAIKHKPKSRKFDRFNYVNVCKVSLILSPNGCPMSLKCSSKVIYSSLILLCPFEFRALINVLLKYYLVE